MLWPGTLERWFCTPKLVWYLPVIKADREMLQIGPVTNARVKRVPRAASASTFGVWIAVWP